MNTLCNGHVEHCKLLCRLFTSCCTQATVSSLLFFQEFFLLFCEQHVLSYERLQVSSGARVGGEYILARPRLVVIVGERVVDVPQPLSVEIHASEPRALDNADRGPLLYNISVEVVRRHVASFAKANVAADVVLLVLKDDVGGHFVAIGSKQHACKDVHGHVEDDPRPIFKLNDSLALVDQFELVDAKFCRVAHGAVVAEVLSFD
mmetsp:Transcript_171/g.539  ORF Transcript_171/g.539 Transcript_171/m.539 type:complete len:205 (+) Transcript_171:112-726(+)